MSSPFSVFIISVLIPIENSSYFNLYYEPHAQKHSVSVSFIQFHFNLTKHMDLRRELFSFLLCS